MPSTGAQSEAIRARAAAADATMAKYQQLLAQAKAERGAIQLELDAISYDILSLPIEILTTIFANCALPAEDALHYLETDVAPRLLTHVCKRWRDIACSTPTLWSTICVDFNLRHVEGELAEHVRRAGAIPLDVTLQGDCDTLTDEENSDGDVLVEVPATQREHIASLAPFLDRIQCLCLDVTEDVAIALEAQLCEPTIPSFAALKT